MWKKQHLLSCCSTPAGCRCSPCPQNGDKNARCVYGVVICAAQFLCQSSETKDKTCLKYIYIYINIQVEHHCAQGSELRAYLFPLVRFGDARMRDDFGCVNFAGGEVGHLITFSKSSLEKGTTLLTCFVFGLGKSQGGKNVFKEKKKRWNACATFPKTFPRQ